MKFIHKFHDHNRFIIDFACRHLCDSPYFEVPNQSFYWIWEKRLVSDYQKEQQEINCRLIKLFGTGQLMWDWF
jgi:hypothetical protein